MSFDYAKSQATALKLITNFGADAIIIRAGEQTGPAYNPTIGPPTEHACKAVNVEWEDGEIDGTLIQSTDLKLLVAASGLSITPTTADKINWLGKEYGIQPINPLSPAGTPLLYTIAAKA